MINNLKRHKLTEAILKFSLSTLFFILFTASAHQYKEIADLIEQRLSYMKYVARYKFEKHLPVEDRTQENKVILNSINKAEALGLDKKSIEPFMISQINAAIKQFNIVTKQIGCPCRRTDSKIRLIEY